MIDAESLTIEDVTPAVLEEGVKFTSMRGWHGERGYKETEVDDVFDVLADAWAALTRERDQWRVEAMAARPGRLVGDFTVESTRTGENDPPLVLIPDPQPVASSDPDEVGMLTFTEHRAVEACVELWTLLNEVTAGGRTRQGDLAELVVPLHQLQNAILAQAAARAYPTRYRLLGSSVGEQPFDGDVEGP